MCGCKLVGRLKAEQHGEMFRPGYNATTNAASGTATLPVGAIVGIVIGLVAGLALLLAIIGANSNSSAEHGVMLGFRPCP